MSHVLRSTSAVRPAPTTFSTCFRHGALLALGLLLFGTDFTAHAQGRKRTRPATPVIRAESTERITGTPVITSFWPIAAPEGSTIKVNGRNLRGAAAVLFNGISSPVMNINQGGTQITTTVPAGANSGMLRVLSAMTTGVGTFGMFNVAPVISSFSPNEWFAGTVITINGRDLQNTQSVEIGVGSGILAQNVNVNAAGTQITCTVPAAVSSLPADMRYRLKVSTPRGTGRSNLGMLRVQPTGLAEESLQLLSGLWPNPAHDRVTVTLGAARSEAPVQLLDALGRVVRTQPVTAGAAEVVLSLDGLATGPYVVRRGASVQRLIME